MKLTSIVLSSVAGILLAQFIRPDFSAPPPVREPAWDSPVTARLVHGACYDCHSRTLQVPWYGQISPVSWFLADHIMEGREKLDFQSGKIPETHELIEEIQTGEMPLSTYTWMHPHARLTTSQRDSLMAGLKATFGNASKESQGTVAGESSEEEAKER